MVYLAVVIDLGPGGQIGEACQMIAFRIDGAWWALMMLKNDKNSKDISDKNDNDHKYDKVLFTSKDSFHWLGKKWKRVGQ